MKHNFETHQGCEDPYCNICVGGLSNCVVCGMAEGQLTTDCPGVRVPHYARDESYAGRLNFRNGAWRREPNWVNYSSIRNRQPREDDGTSL